MGNFFESNRVFSAGQNLYECASRQARFFEETSSLIDRMASLYQQSDEYEDTGKETVSAFNGLDHALSMGNYAISEIEKNTEEVRKVINAIDKITSKMDLLINSSGIEDARSAEDPTGLEIDAEVICAFVQKSAESACETAKLVEKTVNSLDRITDLT